jgi:hypothetical protein
MSNYNDPFEALFALQRALDGGKGMKSLLNSHAHGSDIDAGRCPRA